MTALWYTGDVFEMMAGLPDGSVDLVLTSPPFLALRSYLPADHPDKAKEIGSEPNPAAFIDTLMDLTVEWRRLLAPHGSLCVELGDTYSGSTTTGGDYTNVERGRIDKYRRGDEPESRRMLGPGWPLAKSLCLIPELYRIALVYGFNPLNPEHRMEPWRARNVVRWCRPNPPVGALGDKFRPATSEMVVACVSGRRYFDLDAVREEPRPENQRGTLAADGKSDRATLREATGAPPLDWWEIPTHPYKGSHYATWPPELCVRPIKAMCPERVCRECGKPSERIVGKTPEYEAFRAEKLAQIAARKTSARDQAITPTGFANAGTAMNAEYETLGWTDCGCSPDDSHWRPGVVLDPFAGSGTTLAVATGHGRDAIGIDLDPRNLDLARERVGMFLEVAA